MDASQFTAETTPSLDDSSRRLFMKLAAASGAAMSMTGASIAQEGDDDSEESAEDVISEGPTIGLERVAEGFTSPVGFEVAPGQEDRYYVVDQVGQIHVVETGGTVGEGAGGGDDAGNETEEGMGAGNETDNETVGNETDEGMGNETDNETIGGDNETVGGDNETVGNETEEGMDSDNETGGDQGAVGGAGQVREEPFLDIADRMVDVGAATDAGFDERGLLGLAFHPDFEENGRFFVRYSAPPTEDTPEDYDHTEILAEFTTTGDDNETGDPDSEQILLEAPEPQFNHNAGVVLFGPDGYLYVPLGDGGGADDVGLGHVEDWYEDNEGGNGQNTTENVLGGIHRLDVDAEGDGDRPYGIPEDNPFVGSDQGLDEYYAWGLRNPWRASFDSEGTFFVADVGQNLFEEVNIVERGGNYGWNVKEGIECFSTEDPSQPAEDCPSSTPEDVRGGESLLDPVIHYPHQVGDETIGISITGGYHYEGEMVSELQDMYVYGDWSTNFAMPAGRLFASPIEEYEPSENRSEDDLWEIQELSVADSEDGGIQRFVLAFGRDHDDELYVLTTARYTDGETGEVWRIVPEGEGETIEPHENAVGAEGDGEEEEDDEGDNETEEDTDVGDNESAENETVGNESVGNESVGNETVGNETDDNESG